MRGDFAIQLVGFIDQRFQFFKTVLRCADCVAFGKHAAGRASLDHVSAVLDLLAHGETNLFRPIGHSVQRRLFRDARTKSILVTMASGDADRVAGRFHARTDRPAFVDRFAQSHVVEAARSAHVADAREPGHQSVARMQHA